MNYPCLSFVTHGTALGNSRRHSFVGEIDQLKKKIGTGTKKQVAWSGIGFASGKTSFTYTQQILRIQKSHNRNYGSRSHTYKK